jgi:MarR family transcriptional regulator, organic hydroperoxide resistance regulator
MRRHPSRSLPIDDCIIFLLGKAFQRVSEEARTRLAPHGVTPVQFVVLSSLWARDGQSGAELTAHLRIDSATITGVVDRLATAGWVARARDPVDRRVQRVKLTRAGHALQAATERQMVELNREIAARLGDRAETFWTMLAEIGGTGTTKDRARRL